MKRMLLGFLVFAALSLVCASAALAAPVGPSGEGLSVFADYDSWWYESFMVGVGYGVTENLTLGAFYVVKWEGFGVYANLALGPIRLNGELVFDEWCYDGIVTALYAFDLDPLTLGVGGGLDFCEDWGVGDFFISATVEFALDPLTIYGGIMYYPKDSDWTSLKIGAVWTF